MKIIVLLLLVVSFLFSNIDINSASFKELETLKGIGKVKARSIVDFRKSHCFKSISELTLVKGIGKKTLEKNRENLSVGTCK